MQDTGCRIENGKWKMENCFLDTDYTDGHGSGLYCLNNGVIVQTMLPFHKCCCIYEINSSVISEIRVRDFLSSPEG